MSRLGRSAGATRRELLAAGAATGGALLAGPAVTASARGGAPPSDGGLLSRVLGTAQLAAYVYEAVFAEHIIKGGRRRALDGFDEQERYVPTGGGSPRRRAPTPRPTVASRAARSQRGSASCSGLRTRSRC